MVDRRGTVDKIPEKARQALSAITHGEKGLGIANGGRHLESIADNPGIRQQGSHLRLVITGDLFRIEAIKNLPIVLTLAQHRDPAEARLGTFQIQALEQGLIVIFRNAPFFIMVALIERVIPAPGTAVFHRLLSFHTVRFPGLHNPQASGQA